MASDEREAADRGLMAVLQCVKPGAKLGQIILSVDL